MPLIECVPNFSEGVDSSVVSAICQAVREVHGLALLDTTSDADHNRSVLSFAGRPAAVVNAAVAAVRAAVARIDLTAHAGVHPRLGAADVIPFVPLAGSEMDAAVSCAHEAGERIWRELRVPVYFYEFAARREECRRLESVRKLAPAGLAPDLGDTPHPTAGCAVVGARQTLVAWNINLESDDLAAARAIAKEIREANGGFPALKALGLSLPTRSQVQVSMNLVDYQRTSLPVIFDAVERLAKARGIRIAGSELIGLIPQAALDATEGHDMRWLNLRPEMILEKRLRLEGLK